MIIKSNINAVIRDDASNRSVSLDKGFTGAVPSWVEKHWYFKALVESAQVIVFPDKTGPDPKKEEKKGSVAGAKGK